MTTRVHSLPAHLGIAVRRGVVPTSLSGGRRLPGGVTVADGTTLVRFPQGALLVEDGTTATVDWPGGSDVPSWVIESWAVSLAMVQRGNLCLHASVVAVGDRVVAIAGDSGAGKSTTVLALEARGHRLLTDDVAIVDLRPDGPWVLPYQRSVHLLPDAAAALDVDFADLAPLADFPEKSAYHPAAPPTDPLPIHAVVLLVPNEGIEMPRVRELRGVEKVQSTMVHAGRPVTSPAIMGEERYFAALTELAARTPVYLLERPEGAWTLDEVCTAIESVAAEKR
ncbi:MAG: hypothetical protein GC156_03745 [Actinomycetales bacterium]|nr:hypothetical protein [Actinomycetales bacterium]